MLMDKVPVATPLATLDAIYTWLGLDPGVRDQMEQWLEANRSGSRGEHRYTADRYGLSADQIRSDFDFYIRTYDVPIEQEV